MTNVRTTFSFDALVEPRHVQAAIALFPPVPGIRPSGEFNIFPDGHTVAVITELDLPHTPENVERVRVLWTTPLQRALVSTARDPGTDTHSPGPKVEDKLPSYGGAVAEGAGNTLKSLGGFFSGVYGSVSSLVGSAPWLVPLLLVAVVVVGFIYLRRR